MFKKFILLLLALTMVLSITSTAFASTSAVFNSCELYIDGSYVKCTGTLSEPGSNISLTMKLYRNGRVVRTWSDSNIGIVSLSGSTPAVSGSTYQLSFVSYINGNLVDMPTRTIVCP